MKKSLTKLGEQTIQMRHGEKIYCFPVKVAEKYEVSKSSDESPISSDVVFERLNKQYTKPGALLRGIRHRENLTQVEIAKKLKVTQSDISQMENGTRRIGRSIAQRIEALFDVDYLLFLE